MRRLKEGNEEREEREGAVSRLSLSLSLHSPPKPAAAAQAEGQGLDEAGVGRGGHEGRERERQKKHERGANGPRALFRGATASQDRACVWWIWGLRLGAAGLSPSPGVGEAGCGVGGRSAPRE